MNPNTVAFVASVFQGSSQDDRTSCATNMNHSLLSTTAKHRRPTEGAIGAAVDVRLHIGGNLIQDIGSKRSKRVSGLIRRVASRSPRRKMIRVSAQFRLRTFLVHGVQTVYLWMQTNFGHGASRYFCFSIFPIVNLKRSQRTSRNHYQSFHILFLESCNFSSFSFRYTSLAIFAVNPSTPISVKLPLKTGLLE